jgi:ubiquinone biosynthesis protein
VIERSLGTEIFARIDREPLAAASIAQIQSALLKDGREVVVKVRRPGVVEQVQLDLDLLRRTVALLEGNSETARLLQLGALTDELEAHLLSELNFVNETVSLVGYVLSALIALYWFCKILRTPGDL